MIEFDYYMNTVQFNMHGINKTIDEECQDNFTDPNLNRTVC